MNKLNIYKNVGLRPISATQMLWNHRRTILYLLRKKKLRNLYNHIFVTYFVRGEDCGKGVLDPLWKFTGWAPFLWDIEMEVTTSCYLRCIHCEHTYFDKSYLNQNLKFEDFKRVVEDIPNLKWINLTGEGSSILNPDFSKMVRYIKDKGIYLDFSHDFVKLPLNDLLDWVVYGVDRIYWSFDGVEKETYEKIRVGANLDSVIDHVRALIELKKEMRSPLPEICFRFAFFKDNIQDVPKIPQFLYSIVDGDVKAYGDEPSINIVSLLEFEETRDWVVEIPYSIVTKVNKECRRLGFKVYWSHITHIEEEKPPLDFCTFWSEPYIMITGHVVPCCAVLMSNNRKRLEELSFGNIYKESLRDIWFSERYRKFRKQVVNRREKCPDICKGCRVFNTVGRAR